MTITGCRDFTRHLQILVFWVLHNVFLQGPGGVWCDVDVVEFSYYGAPAPTPKVQLYTELVDGFGGSDPCIGSGSQVNKISYLLFFVYQNDDSMLFNLMIVYVV